MTATEAATLLGEMTATWPQRALTKPEADVWRRTLGGLGIEAARQAVDELRAESDWMPTHHQVVKRAQDVARRLAGATERIGRGETKSERCKDCDGTGWTFVPVVGGAEAVARCSCSKGQVKAEHRSGCTCLSCSYGPERARRVRAGEDGWERQPDQAHPLALVPPDDEGERF